MIIVMWVTLNGRTFSKMTDWPMLPRVGEEVELTPDGWSEPISYIRWARSGIPQLDLGCQFDTHGEDLAKALVAEGWR